MNNTQTVSDLFLAAESGDSKKLKRILDENPSLVNCENQDGYTPLGIAAHVENTEAVKLLLEYGANINAVSNSKLDAIPSDTELHAVLMGERNKQNIELHIHHNGRENIFDHTGDTSLHSGARNDKLSEMSDTLSKHGAFVKPKVEQGRFALDLVSEKGQENVTDQLKKKGATS
ncbi:ankyrin repeat domain-containing protein [Evansella cellulosilytica]|uniref:Ankyrin n=1 Tax=Evansella cellulosilytica (strain ATCC 21833 / DSM 2522 / FERM P-1141 / JCM 9156 / N-4) TaxID=649639 RepID=E6TUJ7_EVAC2|nr:ankyrin repeat domain-containing protein [Evansella cellulosilytica]ADU30887.1 Ankyrin [Evansella cellulosilytica DSM 2522]